MHDGVTRSIPTPTTDGRAQDGQDPSAPAVPAGPSMPAGPSATPTTSPATGTSTGTTTGTPSSTDAGPAGSATDHTVVVDVAGPPVPAAFQQFGVPGSATAVVAAQGPLPGQALPATGAAPFDTVVIAALLLAAGVAALRVARPARRVTVPLTTRHR